ncbi:hypothetical protein BC829DRAFT_413527 [Chytridium lagenaria]|nr:hypothetical protein BC829DRAFT_413527 [Chytridium lagenaria]
MTLADGSPYSGGIVLGCQSDVVVSKNRWPHNHWQTVFVDSNGHVRAALDTKDHNHIVGPKVNDGRWHHAVLVATPMDQTLYVDGVMSGKLESKISASNYSLLSVWQFGTGVISGNVQGRPSLDWHDAYPFNGLIQSLKLRGKALTESEAKNLYIQGIKGVEEAEENDLQTFIPQLHKNSMSKPRLNSPLVHEDYFSSQNLPSFKLKEEGAFSYDSVILSKLPSEISHFRILASLTYPDIIKLASLSKDHYILDVGEMHWKWRCSPYCVASSDVDAEVPWIHRYGFLSRGLEFGPNPIPIMHELIRKASDQITAEAWIKCLPQIDVKGDAYQGGIILGSQSGSLLNHENGGAWPHYHWQPLMVGADGLARGSFESELHEHIIGPNVADGKWHHLLITANTSEQRFYVDGVKAGSQNTGLNTHMQRLEHEVQVGSGIISGTSIGVPHANWCGPYPFHGIIRDVKLTGRSFTDNDAKLAFTLDRYTGPRKTPDTRCRLPVPARGVIQRPPFHMRPPMVPRPRPLTHIEKKDGGVFDELDVIAPVPGRPKLGVSRGLTDVEGYAEVLYLPLCGKADVPQEMNGRLKWVYTLLPTEVEALKTALI